MTRNPSRRQHRPEADRRDHGHEPAIQGPSGPQIGEALAELVDRPPKETPPVRLVERLTDAGINFPVTVGDRRVLAVGVTRGDPQHGALRSDDHISRWEVEYCAPCPEDDCHAERTRYEYSAHHHISGSEKTYCPRCETVHSREEWG